MMENIDMEATVGKMMEDVKMEEMMSEMVESLEQQMEENLGNGGLEEMMAGSPLGEMMGLMESMDMSAGLEELMANMEKEGGLMGSEMMSQLGDMEMNMKCSCTPLA